MKDFISKNIDILTEKLRFIHNLMVALLSGLAGILVAIANKSIEVNLNFFIIFTIGVLLLVFLQTLKTDILKEQFESLEQLKEL